MNDQLKHYMDKLEYEIDSRIWQLVNDKPTIGLAGYLEREAGGNPFAGGGQPQPEFTTLRRFLGESAAAVGWRGDRYELWDVPGGASLLVAVLAWDTEDLATGFARDYARVLTQKRGAAPMPGDPALQLWPGQSATAALERRHRTVLVIEGAPPALVEALRAAVWAQPVLY